MKPPSAADLDFQKRKAEAEKRKQWDAQRTWHTIVIPSEFSRKSVSYVDLCMWTPPGFILELDWLDCASGFFGHASGFFGPTA